MEHYDVGLYGLWYGHNYGSMITYYALSELVRAMGYSYAMIKNPLGANVNPNTLRRSHVLRFAAEHYPITPLYRLEQMARHNEMFDKFLLGSDQMWNYGLSRPYRQSYFLDFAKDDKAKLAYATSFGRENYNGPPEAIPETRKNLARFDAISVRDAFSKRILREDFGIDSVLVMDPVFLCPSDRYDALIAEAGDFAPDGAYIFSYILDPNPAIGENLEKIAAESGLRVIVALNESGDKDALIASLHLKGDRVTCLREPTVQEWLSLIKNARFILTDSFHGTCFSLIYRKPFLTLKNQRRGPERFPNLLGTFHLEARIVNKAEDFFEKFRQGGLAPAIDYKTAWQSGQKEIEFSWNWLEKALAGSGAPLKRSAANLDKAVTAAVNAESCTGCGACVGVCPKNALSLKPDAHGYYRRAVNAALCVNCGKCTAICPALKLPENRNAAKPDCFAFQAADTALLYASSSGGAFGVLAKEAFRRGGSVAGVAWSGDLRDPNAPPGDWKDDFRAANVLIDRPEDLYKLRRSKYMQSYTGNICRQVKEKLDAGTFVLFEGTPCQTAGLRAYLGKDYENLLIVDILCGNAPSAGFFRKYLEEAFPAGIRSYAFRFKSENYLWDSNIVRITDRAGQETVRRGGKQDDYQRLYHPHVMCPKHCEQCRYQQLPRFGDLTIGDFWGIGKRDPQIDTQKGVSVILRNNEKGRAFLDALPKSEIGFLKKVPLNWLGGNGSALPGRHNWASPKRDQFYENILHMPFREAADRTLKPDYAYLETLPASESKPALRFDTHFLHFRFHPDIWEEAYVQGNLTLFVRPEQPGTGNYASMPLYRCLKKGQTYVLKMRFQARTDSDVINFHVKDSGSALYQVIHAHKLSADQKGRWQNVEISFRPDSDLYDEFMIGAAQIRGPERYIAFQYVYISEKEKT